MKKQFLSLLFVVSMAALVPACKTDEPPLPDNTVQFESAEKGFSSDSSSVTVHLNLDRAVTAATNVVVDLTPTGVAYGTHFTTAPAATNNSITVTVPANSKTASIKVTKVANIFLTGSETIDFTIKSANNSVINGATATQKLKFSSIISSGSALKLNGGAGGASAVNSVFVDFSSNSQTAVARNSWDLGFYNGTDFRVILNATTGATAKALTKTDLTQVTAADTTALASVLILGTGQGTFDLVDNIDGDLSKTVIKAVSATDAENPVYIVNPGNAGTTQKPWYKIRVLRKGTGYTVQYARITETTFKTLDITKDSNLNFSYMSFAQAKAVSVEPTKANWDLVWGLTTYKATETIPYTYSDFVQINYLAGVEAAEVLTSTVSYDAYAEANIASSSFKKERNVIGSNWRTSAGPGGAAAGVKTDRFYVVKDASGNVYKLKFVNYTSTDGGERGYPNIEYKLVKKGS
ncbi:hypothetical protein BWI96_03505 [Siphonobacter sp. SORGH_AS_0500]|uniref:HmuY family protein n=1 Tax=Siphonobacter sp. SORGH_AS_0500 TaxID=1864824 RepID=UPI000CA6DB08|nr:HmuY family protein [Siphonobacter sp. SORGH_AS_0500]PKK38211.1 hypothetical protein BWI96_03505 [Siphonobacter sp. SORGH_AS_0500]